MDKGMWAFLVDYKAIMSKREKIGILILTFIYFAFMGWLYSISRMSLISIGVVTAFGVVVIWFGCWATKYMWADVYDESDEVAESDEDQPQ